MDRGAWQAAVHGVSKSQTRLSDQAHLSTDNAHLRQKALKQAFSHVLGVVAARKSLM